MSSNERSLRFAISLRPSPFHPSPYTADADVTPAANAANSPPSASRNAANPPIAANARNVDAISTDFVDGTITPTTVDPKTPDSDSFKLVSRHISSVSKDHDIESNPLPSFTNDPYQLSTAIKSDGQLGEIKAQSAKRRDGFRGALSKASGRNAWRARKITGFYEDQNETIGNLLMPVEEHVRQAREEEGSDQLRYKIAVQGSFAGNLILAGLQLYGASSSGSLSLFTTMADALFDPLSNITLMLSHRAVKRVDPRKFPSGKARIETAGNIAFCFLMTAVSLVIIVQSIVEIATGSTSATKGFHLPSVIVVAIAFITKLILFLYCWSLRKKYSQIRILWEDHRNDLFINGFGLLTSVGGAKLKWFIDPAGAIVLSCLIIFLWLRTARSEFALLIGSSADANSVQLLTYIAMTHESSMINAIDTVRAYYSGPRLIVEVDVVMDPERSLRETHDVSESLQKKLESLPIVERAYVHVDYETSHAPEHHFKKEL